MVAPYVTLILVAIAPRGFFYKGRERRRGWAIETMLQWRYLTKMLLVLQPESVYYCAPL